mgnify:CR=1 FL=1
MTVENQRNQSNYRRERWRKLRNIKMEKEMSLLDSASEAIQTKSLSNQQNQMEEHLYQHE